MKKLTILCESARDVLEQVLAADGTTSLPRGPGREGAPARALAAAGRDGRGETRIAVGDREVANDRAREPGDSPHFLGVGRRGRFGRGRSQPLRLLTRPASTRSSSPS